MSGRYETLLVEERDDRVVVTLHRPEARNAISGLMTPTTWRRPCCSRDRTSGSG